MSILDRFLNTTSDSGVGFELVNVANPVNWTGLTKALVSSFLGTIVLGLQYGIDAVVGSIVGIFRGLREWLYDPRIVFRYPGGKRTLEPLTGLIPQIEGRLLDIIDATFTAYAGFGWLSYPLAVASILIALYVPIRALAYAREEVL
ncbi:hypothetical protein [Halobacterium litoreum]|uniref:Uncharacterized protein n=1 Tax=Halobacterium litoreum TaxID=2039234 RepID=A0ABD5NA46_9EURY|nr:hypothetical protein [Halobacterium litoreum]UHH14822.1 hypothetical protein LT972_07405 [Halobacterium litoreum]